MPKLVVTENSRDSALLNSGTGMTVTETGYTAGLISVPLDPPKYNIEFLSSVIKQDEEVEYEVARIRVTPAGSANLFAGDVRVDFSPSSKTNHFIKLPKLTDLVANEPDKNSTSKSEASYSFETIFNYIAEDYDNLQVGVDEINLFASIDKVTKDDFIDVRRRSNTNVLNFSRGQRMGNFVFPTMNIKQGTSAAPYYNSLRINQRLDNRISDFTRELGLFDELLQSYLDGNTSDVNFDIQDERLVSQDQSVAVYNLQEFLNSDMLLDSDNFFGLSETQRSSKMSSDFRKFLMKGFLKDVSKTSFRTYEQVFKNHEAHKEVFCYSIDKHDETVQESTKIQTIYAPAMEDSTPVIDSQIKYGKTYAYNVRGHYMVVGNVYEYRVIVVDTDPADVHAIVEVTNRPNIVLIPFNLFTKKINVVQRPPVYPQVTFKTKKDASKSISLYLSPTKSSLKAPFVEITDADEDQKLAMMRIPGGMDVAGNFTFKTNGDQGLYEIFRLEHAPASYSDFRNAKIGEISMSFNTTDAIFKDNVVPNKRYYYIVRNVNQKGLVSNPTIVFEVTLLIDADDARVVVDPYEFPKPREMESSVDFRKLIRITPAVEHLIFNNEQDVLFGKSSLVGTIDNLKLGIVTKSVWGRKFKIRVKSKTSGKIVDLILNVNLTKNKSEEEF